MVVVVAFLLLGVTEESGLAPTRWMAERAEKERKVLMNIMMMKKRRWLFCGRLI